MCINWSVSFCQENQRDRSTTWMCINKVIKETTHVLFIHCHDFLCMPTSFILINLSQELHCHDFLCMPTSFILINLSQELHCHDFLCMPTSFILINLSQELHCHDFLCMPTSFILINLSQELLLPPLHPTHRPPPPH